MSWRASYRATASARCVGPRSGRSATARRSGGIASWYDEIQWQRGHRYLTLVDQIDEGRRRLLWVGQERQVETLEAFFRWFGATRTSALRFICSDMWKPCLQVVAAQAGHALHVLDRFHIAMNLSKAIDEVHGRRCGC